MTTDPSYLGLVVEYCDGGDLRSRLDHEGAIEDGLRRPWISDIAVGMQYLYEHHVEHRDLKSANVLLDYRGRAKVTDFGLAKSDELATHTAGATGGGAAGTPVFMAPELLTHNTFSEKADVYSYGITIWEVLTRDRPFKGMNPAQVITQVCVMHARPPVPQGKPAELVAVMQVTRYSFGCYLILVHPPTAHLGVKPSWG